MALQNALLESRVLVELDPDAMIMESRSAALLDPRRAERLHQYSSPATRRSPPPSPFVERRLNPAREMVFAPFKDGMMF